MTGYHGGGEWAEAGGQGGGGLLNHCDEHLIKKKSQKVKVETYKNNIQLLYFPGPEFLFYMWFFFIIYTSLLMFSIC